MIRSVFVSIVCWGVFFLVDWLFFVFFSFSVSEEHKIIYDPDRLLLPGVALFYAAAGLGVGIAGGSAAAVLHPLFRRSVKTYKDFFSSAPIACSAGVYWLCFVYPHLIHPFVPGRDMKMLAAAAFLFLSVLLLFLLIRGFSASEGKVIFGICGASAIVANVLQYFLPGGLLETACASWMIIGSAGTAGVVFFIIAYFFPYSRYKKTVATGSVVCAAGVMFFYLANTRPAPEVIGEVSPRPSSSAGDATNIILIVMDTVRSDLLSCYGYPKQTTPNIDRFAGDSVLYERGYATASWTVPSIASILTGTYPHAHGAHSGGASGTVFRLSDRNTTLSELLTGQGYRTAGIVSSLVVTRNSGFAQGFQFFYDNIANFRNISRAFVPLRCIGYFVPLDDFCVIGNLFGFREADEINQTAFSWIKQNRPGNPFLLFLHYFDPHDPYYPLRFAAEDNRAVPSSLRRIPGLNPDYVDREGALIGSVLYGGKALHEDEKQYLKTNYENEVMYLDKKIGELLSVLKKKRLYDSSLIILTADHGEYFGEHGLLSHGSGLYEEVIHVPLIIKYPFGSKRAGRIDRPVSLTGIVPTVLDEIGIKVPDSVQGTSFLDDKEQLVISENYLHAEKGRERYLMSLVSDQYKYIRALHKTDEFYNLREDKGESNNLLGKGVSEEKTLLHAINDYISRQKIVGKQGEDKEVNSQMMQNLKALGYVQ